MSVYLAEFLGTFFLILIGGGVVAGVLLKGSKAFGAGWNAIVVAWGLAVTFAIYGVGSISGAHINPAVTLGFAFVGEFPWSQVPGYILAQVAGGFAGGTIVWIFYMPHWSRTEDKIAKRSSFFNPKDKQKFIVRQGDYIRFKKMSKREFRKYKSRKLKKLKE